MLQMKAVEHKNKTETSMCVQGGGKKSMHSHSATHIDVDPMLNALRIGTAVQGCSNKHGLGSGASSTVQWTKASAPSSAMAQP